MTRSFRKGVLENGMTYYIRHNGKPEGQAEFWIVHNVGAVQEEDSQQGLAHFLEHMAFNGTANFPGKRMMEWLEGIGVKFGYDLNAFTTREYTCYRVSNVPLVRETVVDSCLLILHDWSHCITLDGGEIDKERGVIIEELRQGEGPARRMWCGAAPLLYGDTRYATRNLIGHIDGLSTFPHDELRDFYGRWYRPDLQAVIVVGDFDVDEMEAKVRAVMSDIPAKENPEPKRRITLPDNAQPVVGLFTDPEATMTSFSLYYKRPLRPFESRNTRQGNLNTLCDGMMMYAMNLRLAELAMRPGASFVSAYVAGDPVASFVSDVMRLTVNVKEGELLQAVTELYTEMERVSRYGFTEAEFGVVKADYERMVQRIFDSRDDRFNQNFTAVYRDNFLYNRPAMDARTEYETDMVAVAALSFEEFNDYVKRQFSDENQVLVAYAPEGAPGLPTVGGAGDGPGAGTRRRAGRDFARNRRGTFASGGYAAEGRPREEDGGGGVRLDGLDTPQRRTCRRETYGFHDRPGVPVCPCSRRSVVALRRGDACRTGAGLLYRPDGRGGVGCRPVAQTARRQDGQMLARDRSL